jgi:hypothetical protein
VEDRMASLRWAHSIFETIDGMENCVIKENH